MAGTRKKDEATKPEDYVEHHEGHADIKLSRPLNIAGAPVQTLRMREPTVRDQLTADAAKGSDVEKEIAFFANLCEITPDQVKMLTVRDYKRLAAAFVGFTD